MQDWSKWSVIFFILHKFLLHLACFLEVNASLLAYWDINISLNDESQVVYQAILQLLCMLLWISVYVSHWVRLFSSGESGEEIVARLKRDLLPTMFKGVMYWPVCDFITFRFIPVHLQVCDEVLPCLLSHMFFCTLLFSWAEVKLLPVLMIGRNWISLTNTFFFIGVPLTAIGEQFIFVSMDYLSDVYGESRKSCHNCKLIGSVFPLSISRSSPRSTLDTLSWWLTQNCYELDPLLM